MAELKAVTACRRASAVAVVGLLAVMAAPTAAGTFDAETFTLDNGMQVVVVPNHRAPVLTHMVWYKVGAADEVPGKSGVAHFLEHLMFKGTETLGPGEFSDIIAQNGGRENAFTSQDYTGYYQNVAADRLETMMRWEADRMANLKLTDEVVLPERDVVLEERRSRVDNDPASILGEQSRAAMYLNHPYGTPVIGWEHEIAELTTQDAIDWHRRWYAPNNAILIVAGDITAARLKPLAEKYYGVIPARAVPERRRPQEPPATAPRRITLKDSRVRQPSWNRSYVAPSYNAGETRHVYALQVLADILGGSSTSRLYRALVVEGGLAAGAGAYYSDDSLDLTTFGLYAQPRVGVDVADVEAAMDAEVERLLQDGVTEDEVAGAIRRMQAAAIYARDNYATGARVIGAALTSGRTVAEVEAWPDRVGAVTAAQVNAAAKAVLRPNGSVTATLLPEPTS